MVSIKSLGLLVMAACLALPAWAAKQPLWVLQGSHKAAAGLRAAGARPLGRLPSGGYLFDLGPLDRRLLAQSHLRWQLRPYSPSEQRAPGLTEALAAGRLDRVSIVGMPGLELEQLVGVVRRLTPGLTIERRHAGGRHARVVVSGPDLSTALQRLAGAEEVFWLQSYQVPVPLNDRSVEPLQINCGPALALACTGSLPLALTPVWDQSLTGGGQIIAIADTGLDRNEDWFTEYNDGSGTFEALTDAVNVTPPALGPFFPERKVVAYWVMPGATAYDENVNFGHGTHVTGTAAGDRGLPATPDAANHDGDMNTTGGDGMAPNAQILFQDIGIGSALVGQGGEPMWQQALAAGAHIHSNSYGSPPPQIDSSCLPTGEGPDSYLAEDAELDAFLADNPDMLLVFAAGNCGAAERIFHPGSAKNALTVGALAPGASLNRANFSSQGPTSDNRIKPDIMAPGSNVVSADNDAGDTGLDPSYGFDVLSGTSMATPAVAGMAALARQYFVEGLYPTGARQLEDVRSPSGALLKALLINGAENSTYPQTPSNATGWGRLWLDNSLYFSTDLRGLRLWDRPAAAGLADGEQHQYQVSVAAGEELRVTLVWYDPAPIMGGVALVNNLDLEVEPAGQDVYLGNVFSGGESVPLGSPDSLNPVEGVIVRSPMALEHTIRVKGTAVPGTGMAGSDRQGYALVVSAAACATAVLDAPVISLPLMSDITGIQLDLDDPVAGAQGYQIYRADGDCSAPVSDFQLIGTSAGTLFNDPTTTGGFDYAYRVRAVDGCGEGPISACQTIESAAPCLLAPDFDLDSTTLSGAGSCQASIDWSAAQAVCPAASGIQYQVLRDTDPYFDPQAVTPLADNLTATSLIDDQAPSGLSHFYRVRAFDNLGNFSPASKLLRYSAVDLVSQPGVDFVDPLEDGNPGTRELLSLAELDDPWRITDLRASDDTFSYHNANDNQSTPNQVCAALTSPELSLGGAPQLSYQALFDLETDFDGLVVEISTDGGANWQDLPPDGGYPGDFSQTGNPATNACGYPASQGAFSGQNPSYAVDGFDPYSTNLAAYAGQSVRIRWRYSADAFVGREGFFLDQIQVTDASRPLDCNDLLLRDGFE